MDTIDQSFAWCLINIQINTQLTIDQLDQHFDWYLINIPIDGQLTTATQFSNSWLIVGQVSTNSYQIDKKLMLSTVDGVSTEVLRGVR